MNRKLLLRASLALILSAPFTGFVPQAQAGVSVGVSITIAPPALPVYEQPPLPAPGYIWTPGYWAWGPDGYYWVPGTWVYPPQVGYLWTPGYWGWSGGFYLWHAGYWGPRVGFYGGINYGFGYGGVGYEGGYWRGNNWYYNRDCNRFGPNVHVTHVYERTVVNNITVNRVSYNGGAGGIDRRPTGAELAAARGPHRAFTAQQQRHQLAASRDRDFLASVNHGRPAVMATARPASFGPHGSDASRREMPMRTDRPPGAAARISQPGNLQRAPGAAGGPQPGQMQRREMDRPNRADRPPGVGSGAAEQRMMPRAQTRAPQMRSTGQERAVEQRSTPAHVQPQRELRRAEPGGVQGGRAEPRRAQEGPAVRQERAAPERHGGGGPERGGDRGPHERDRR